MTNTQTWAPPTPPQPQQQRSRFHSRGRKAVAALVGMSLAGGAAFAAFSWWQSVGSGTTADATFDVTLDAAQEAAISTTNDLSYVGTQYVTARDIASAVVALDSITDATFSVDLADQYPGNAHRLELDYSNASGRDMKLVSVTVADGNGDAFASGAPVAVRVVKTLTSRGERGGTMNPWTAVTACTEQTMTTTAGDLDLVLDVARTSAAAVPFQILVEFAPAEAAVASTETNCQLGPFTTTQLGL